VPDAILDLGGRSAPLFRLGQPPRRMAGPVSAPKPSNTP
jgi:hypothetical protein